MKDFVSVSGPEAVSFLQGQLSQDVDALAVGDSAWSLLLQPQGKVDALLRVTRVEDDVLVLDVDAGWGDAVVARLQRFKLRTKADLDRLDWGWLPQSSGTEAGVFVVPELHDGRDVIGPDVSAAVPPDYEARRIAEGWPRMGAELDASTIPAEAGIVERTVSFTKGCYTGQELVARIDSRGGNVPRRLRGVTSPGAVPVGAAVVVEGRDVGSITSSADGVALAYVGRVVEPPAAAEVRWDGGAVAATVLALPL